MREFEVEAPDTPLVAFEAEVAAVGALVSYVQVERVVQPVNGSCSFIQTVFPPRFPQDC